MFGFPGFQHTKGKAEHKEENPKKNGSFLKDIGGLGAPDLVSNTRPKSGTETFLFGTLHEHQQNEQQTRDDEQGGDEINGKGQHGRVEFGRILENDKRQFIHQAFCKMNIQPASGTRGLSFDRRFRYFIRAGGGDD